MPKTRSAASQETAREPPKAAMAAPDKWHGKGKMCDGKMYYSSASVNGVKISKGDSVFIHSGEELDFVAKVTGLFRNLTDDQDCAEIQWLYWPAELEKQLGKKFRENIPEYSETEIFVTDVPDTVSLNTISGKAKVLRRAVLDPAPESLKPNEVVTRWHFADKSKVFTPAVPDRAPSREVKPETKSTTFTDVNNTPSRRSKQTSNQRKSEAKPSDSRDLIPEPLQPHVKRWSPRVMLPHTPTLPPPKVGGTHYFETLPSNSRPPILSPECGRKRINFHSPKPSASVRRDSKAKDETIATLSPSTDERTPELKSSRPETSPPSQVTACRRQLNLDAVLDRVTGDSDEEDLLEEEEGEEEGDDPLTNLPSTYKIQTPLTMNTGRKEVENSKPLPKLGSASTKDTPPRKAHTRGKNEMPVSTDHTPRTPQMPSGCADTKSPRSSRKRTRSKVGSEPTTVDCPPDSTAPAPKKLRLASKETQRQKQVRFDVPESRDVPQEEIDCLEETAVSASGSDSPVVKRRGRPGKTADPLTFQSVDVQTPTSREVESTRIRSRKSKNTRSSISTRTRSTKNQDNPVEKDDDAHMPSENEGEGSEDEEVWSEDSDFVSHPQTPKQKKPRSATPATKRRPTKTPSSVGKNTKRTPVRRSPAKTRTPRRKELTPCVPRRRVDKMKSRESDPFETARERLHISAVPESLPCRENEFASICAFVEGKLQDGTGGCMYISGVPGTGKTATVHEVTRYLRQAADEGELPDFQYVEINGMRLTEPQQAFVAILKQLTGERATPDHASALLERYFSDPKRSTKTIVLLADELDLLWTRKQTVLYNLFDWPTRQHARLVVLAVANTMDLPERIMMNRVSSRLGLTRLTFQPYTFRQLQEIVTSRMEGLRVFEPDAVQLAARKVAAVSGDARRALDICRRATELAQGEPKASGRRLVGMSHVDQVVQEMFSSLKVMAIRHASLHEKMFLRGVLSAFRSSGTEETTFKQVCQQLDILYNAEGMRPAGMGELGGVCSRLGSCRLLLVEGGKMGALHRRVRLNVNQDDIIFALREN